MNYAISLNLLYRRRWIPETRKKEISKYYQKEMMKNPNVKDNDCGLKFQLIHVIQLQTIRTQAPELDIMSYLTVR